MNNFIEDLANQGIEISLKGDDLSLHYDHDVQIKEETILLIREKKQKILNYLSSGKLSTIPVSEVIPGGYPVTSSQYRMWVLSQLDEVSSGYNISFTSTISGSLDTEVLRSSFFTLVDRYEILRTYFIYDAQTETVKQVVVSPEEFSLDFIEEDYRHDASPSESIRSYIQKDQKQSFNLNIPSLFKLRLFQIEEQKFVIYLSMHHIIGDGWSLNVMLSEVIRIYYSKIIHNNTSFSPLSIQYKDYTLWLQSEHERVRYKKAEDFWLSQYSVSPPSLDLPSFKKRPDMKTYNGKEVRHQYAVDLSRTLREYALEHKTSLFTVLESGLKTLLYRYSNQQDIVIGTPVAGREHPNLENQIGLFINTLPLRTIFKEKNTFSELVQTEKHSFLSAYQHQIYPFDELLHHLDLPYAPSRSPLFDILIVFQNQDEVTHNDIQEIAGLQIEFNNVEKYSSRFDMTFTFRDTSEGLSLSLEYNTDIYEDLQIERLFIHFENLLRGALAEPSIYIESIDYLTDEERNQLVKEFNDTDVDYPRDKTIIDLFEEQCERTPDNIALVFEDKELTYRELNERANQLGRYLRETNSIKSDDMIGLKLDRSENIIISILGVLKSGGAYVPIDVDYPEERIEYIEKDIQAKVIINHDFLDQNREAIRSLSKDNLPIINSPESLAYIIYTSGTTGQPKGVMIEHKNVVRLLINEKNLFHFDEKDVWTMFHSYFFDFSVWEMYGSLLYGGKLIVISKDIAKDTHLFAKVIETHKVTVLNQTPSAFYNLIEETLKNSRDFALRYIIFGGEALHPGKLKEWVLKYPEPKLINMYGITETTVHVTFKEITHHEIEKGISNIGKAIPTLQCYVLDENRQLLPVGSKGELCIGGDGVARGYLNKPELTGEKFVKNPYKEGDYLYCSGDLARVLETGDLEYLGRKDHQVKIRGHRIELGEIETHISGYSKNIQQVVADAREVNGEKVLAAFYTTSVSGEIDKSDLRKYLQNHLPEYMIPGFFVELDKIPLTSNGKIDRKSLPGISGSDLIRKEYIAPVTELEKDLSDIWQEVLGVDQIGIIDNFFVIGGDSILVLKIISRINNHLGTVVSVGDMYRYFTIESLSKHIQSLSNNERSAKISNEIKSELLEEYSVLKESILSSDKLNDSDNVADIYPMSPIETGMVYTTLRFPETGVYHDQFLYFNKFWDFNIERFRKALELLVNKHDILRTEYNIEDFDSEVRIVRRHIPVNIFYKDISNLNQIKRLEYREEYVASELKNPFTLNKSPLWRLSVFKEGADNYSFVWQFHHSILDGWSNASFITELNNTYLELEKSPDFVPSKLQSTYKDYVIENDISRRDISVQNFWKDELEDYIRLDVFEESQENIFEDLTDNLNKDYTERLRSFSKTHGVSLKSVSLSVFSYLLQILNYEGEVVLGLVGNTRPAVEDSDKVLGCFLNTIPFKVNIFSDTEENVVGFIKRIEGKMTSLKGYDQLALSDISSLLLVKSSKNQNPFFDITFNYIDFHVLKNIEVEEFDQIEENNGEYTEVGSGSARELTNTYLDIDINTSNEGFKASFRLTRRLKGGLTLSKISSIYFSILRTFIDSPSFQIKNIQYVDDSELALLDSFNQVEQNFSLGKDIVTLFRENVEKYGDKTAVEDSRRQLNYKELDFYSTRIAHYLLKNHSPHTDELFGVIMDRSVTMCETILGIWKSGSGYVPIDKNYPKERILQIINNSGMKGLFIDGSVEESIVSSLLGYVTLINVNELPKEDIIERDDPIDIPLSSLAYVIYTSGSTGVPKGAMIEHLGMLNHMGSKIVELGMNDQSRVAQNAPHTFDISVWQMFSGLVCGGTTVIYDYHTIIDVPKFCHQLREDYISVLELVPSYFSEMLYFLEKNRSSLELKDLNILVLNAETLFPRVVNQWLELYSNIPIVNTYGITETSDDLSHYIMRKKIDTETTPILKRPIQHIEIHIVDSNLRRVPVGVTGEIIVAGLGVGRGYLNDKERTGKVFLQGPIKGLTYQSRIYRTGDLGRYSEDGTMEFLGRTDYQIKVGGHRVELPEIENKLNLISEIKDAIVLDIKNKRGDTFLVAFYTAKEEIIEQELKVHLKEQLPSYMIPAYFVELDKFPLNPNGKINRKVLREWKINNSVALEVQYTGDFSDLEKELLEEWKYVLGREDIGLNDDFFDLGGNSFKAIRLIARNKHNYTINELYDNPTVNTLGKIINKKEKQQIKKLLDTLILSKKETVSLLVIPNSAGESINFRDLSNSIEQISENVSVYGVQLPRVQPLEGENYEDMRQKLLVDLVAEIKDNIKTPIIIYGQCNGTALAIGLADFLRNDNIMIKGLYLGALFPAKSTNPDPYIKTDHDIISLLEKLKATYPEESPYKEFFIENIRYDSIIAYLGFYYYSNVMSKGEFVKFNFPIYSVVGEKDPITKYYTFKYKKLKKFSRNVKLHVIKNTGHYLHRDAPSELAQIIVKTTDLL